MPQTHARRRVGGTGPKQIKGRQTAKAESLESGGAWTRGPPMCVVRDGNSQANNKGTATTMSERGQFRGGRGRGRGGDRGGRGGGARGGAQAGGGGGGGGGGGAGGQTDRPKKENILDLNKYMDKQITVKFSGGREVIGTLKGYDQLMNLVLDEVKEALTDDEGNIRYRKLGLIVARGTLLVVISPVDGSEEIANPFIQQEED
ncbi:hypothetical protein LEMA_P088880.1 [Plenodomus lingam JN3]|uniref:Sm domain-containing protein n=1 Tax=Leptosphaeria maculans (strain JN3 / isolate v23.1.3 / race Av1-4-5-6-7-8) TaxID=985895 RepID=E5A7Q4_LEPMJ|nr:hypothetical protein LEMA_P088880.1 [Plenodomus lingam JN3]CBX99649.1 hypothetical protein LEMA_P088880.1 [Plenodomus lingam JN3]